MKDGSERVLWILRHSVAQVLPTFPERKVGRTEG
jgi:hypothetical protein